jgi:transposase InsO family protein
VLYCFFIIAHDRRRILHCTVTKHPNSAWVVQQLREAFPYDSAPGYLIFDRGASFNEEVIDTVKSFGIQPKRTSFQSPWQNGVSERWVGNCRWDLLDHVIVLNERQLKRLLNAYILYYHDDRTHLALQREPLRIANQRRTRIWAAESCPCQDLVACITVTVWPLELLLRTSLRQS